MNEQLVSMFEQYMRITVTPEMMGATTGVFGSLLAARMDWDAIYREMAEALAAGGDFTIDDAQRLLAFHESDLADRVRRAAMASAGKTQAAVGREVSRVLGTLDGSAEG